MHPVQLLIGGFLNFFSIGLIAADIYLFREWNEYRHLVYQEKYAQRCLLFAIVLLLIISLGKVFLRFLLGKKGTNEPDMERSKDFLELERPEGHKLHIEFYGPVAAPPLIFIHGWSSNSTQWYYFKEKLSKEYRMMLVDLPGLGKSGKPSDNDYSLPKFSRDLDAVINLCGKQKPIILGHSIGGMTILTACKLQGRLLYKKISGIVLLHTTYTDPSHTSILSGLLTALEKPVFTPLLYIMIGLAPLFQLMNWIKFFNGSMHLSNAFTGYAGSETKGQLDLTAYLSTIAPVGVVARGCLAMFKYDATQVLPSIEVPVLVIAGKNDKLTKASAGKFIADSVPDSSYKLFEPSAHMGVLERNDQEVEAVADFAETTFFQAREKNRRNG